MSAWWQFKALMRKNILTLKRSIFMTLMEIFYPIILMLICYLIKLAFDSTKVTWEDEEGLEQYLINKGNFGFDYSIYSYLIDFNQKLKDQPSGTTASSYLPNFINDNVPPADQASVTSKLTNILQNLSPGSGVWKYIDPLEEIHNIDVSTIAGLPAKPLTMICINRFTSYNDLH